MTNQPTDLDMLFSNFMDAMPELSISPQFQNAQKIVDECYGGNVAAYIKESFDNYLLSLE